MQVNAQTTGAQIKQQLRKTLGPTADHTYLIVGGRPLQDHEALGANRLDKVIEVNIRVRGGNGNGDRSVSARWNGGSTTLTANANTTGAQIKRQLRETLGPIADATYLIVGGRPLQDHEPLGANRLDSIIEVNVRNTSTRLHETMGNIPLNPTTAIQNANHAVNWAHTVVGQNQQGMPGHRVAAENHLQAIRDAVAAYPSALEQQQAAQPFRGSNNLLVAAERAADEIEDFLARPNRGPSNNPHVFSKMELRRNFKARLKSYLQHGIISAGRAREEGISATLSVDAGTNQRIHVNRARSPTAAELNRYGDLDSDIARDLAYSTARGALPVANEDQDFRISAEQDGLTVRQRGEVMAQRTQSSALFLMPVNDGINTRDVGFEGLQRPLPALRNLDRGQEHSFEGAIRPPAFSVILVSQAMRITAEHALEEVNHAREAAGLARLDVEVRAVDNVALDIPEPTTTGARAGLGNTYAAPNFEAGVRQFLADHRGQQFMSYVGRLRDKTP